MFKPAQRRAHSPYRNRPTRHHYRMALKAGQPRRLSRIETFRRFRPTFNPTRSQPSNTDRLRSGAFAGCSSDEPFRAGSSPRPRPPFSRGLAALTVSPRPLKPCRWGFRPLPELRYRLSSRQIQRRVGWRVYRSGISDTRPTSPGAGNTSTGASSVVWKGIFPAQETF